MVIESREAARVGQPVLHQPDAEIVAGDPRLLTGGTTRNCRQTG
jgi:hypothetical protein